MSRCAQSRFHLTNEHPGEKCYRTTRHNTARQDSAAVSDHDDATQRGATMADVKAKAIEEIPFYKGPNTIPGIRFHTAGREHDHTKDGQEEVYLVLKGGGTLAAGGEKITLLEGTLVRVGPSTKRKILPGPEGITVLAIGGTPGQAYPAR